MYNYKDHNFQIIENTISKENISALTNELLDIGNNLDANNNFTDINELWNYYCKNNRSKGGAIYNGFKYLPSIHSIAYSDEMIINLKEICMVQSPALIDINCRIDSYEGEKFLFDWHQDYWFSVASKNAVVVWIPITGLDSTLGGLEIIPFNKDEIKIYNTKKGDKYNSYADAIKLNDSIPKEKALSITDIKTGSALFFSFSSLHKSLPVLNKSKSRFTIQLRFADFEDDEFIQNNYKPGQVKKDSIDYLKNKEEMV